MRNDAPLHGCLAQPHLSLTQLSLLPCLTAIHLLLQVARLEQRVLAVSTECEALSASLDEARSAADGARSAAHAALEGLGQQPRERWPRSVLLVVQAAEAAVREEAAQKAVSTGAAGAVALEQACWCTKRHSHFTFTSQQACWLLVTTLRLRLLLL
jgi:hypothetical protein